jgi:hypothetical protein
MLSQEPVEPSDAARKGFWHKRVVDNV